MEMSFIQDQIKLDKINRNMDRMMQIVYGLKNLPSKDEHLQNTQEKIEQLRNGCKLRVPERNQLIQSHFEQYKEHCSTPYLRYFAHCALHSRDFFAKDAAEHKSEVYNYLLEELSLNEQQLSELKKLQPGLLRLGTNFKK